MRLLSFPCLMSGSGARVVVVVAAAVSKAPGQPLEMEEVEVAPPPAHEVRVRIVCTSLCHTDFTFWRMKVRMPGRPSADSEF